MAKTHPFSLWLLACFLPAVTWGVPVAGKGDPLLNPLFSGARQQSFSSMRVGELSSRADVSVATMVNSGNQGPGALRVLEGGRISMTGRFLTVERSNTFQLEFGFAGVTAFAFNLGGLTHDTRVELYDESMRLVESFRVRALGPDANGAFIGAYTPTVPVHFAVFTSEGVLDSLAIDNLTVVPMKPPMPPPPLVPLRGPGRTDGSGGSEVFRVPDQGSGAIWLGMALVSLVALRRRFVRRS